MAASVTTTTMNWAKAQNHSEPGLKSAPDQLTSSMLLPPHGEAGTIRLLRTADGYER